MTIKSRITFGTLGIIILIVIIWTVKILLTTPIASQISTGTGAIESGIPPVEKALIDQKGN